MIKLFVRSSGQNISPNEFREFLKEFKNRKKLKFSLCKKLKDEWRNFVEAPDKFKDNPNVSLPNSNISLPNPKCLPKGNPKSMGGIYGIFVKFQRFHKPKCFYVGVSKSDVRGRIRTHLGKDIRENYRHVFKVIKKCSEVFICCAYTHSRFKSKAKLELLELCLSEQLRPGFLVEAAMVENKLGGR